MAALCVGHARWVLDDLRVVRSWLAAAVTYGASRVLRPIYMRQCERGNECTCVRMAIRVVGGMEASCIF
jgi:hypothetical protein